MKNLWLKWAILVWLNTIVGWYFGADNQWGNIPYIVGIAMGVCLFIPLYVAIEKNAEHKNQPHLKKAITIGGMNIFVLTGLILSGVVAVLTVIIMGVLSVFDNQRHVKQG